MSGRTLRMSLIHLLGGKQKETFVVLRNHKPQQKETLKILAVLSALILISAISVDYLFFNIYRIQRNHNLELCFDNRMCKDGYVCCKTSKAAVGVVNTCTSADACD